MSERLKREFIELLERGVEFRYTVAGYLGLSEILRRLDRLEEGQGRLLERLERLWRSHNERRESHNRQWESHNKLWEEVRSLREGHAAAR
ncbi:MAG: hypothetical protein QXM16_03635 [Nitrososphaerota archaeon]